MTNKLLVFALQRMASELRNVHEDAYARAQRKREAVQPTDPEESFSAGFELGSEEGRCTAYMGFERTIKDLIAALGEDRE